LISLIRSVVGWLRQLDIAWCVKAFSFRGLRGIQAPLAVETGEKCITALKDVEEVGTA